MNLANNTGRYSPGENHASPANGNGRIRISHSEKQLTIETALPAVDPQQVEVSILDDVLTISAERRRARRARITGSQWQEYSHSSYSRSVQLPREAVVDAARASFGNGVLTVTIPKGEPTPPKRIEVTRQ